MAKPLSETQRALLLLHTPGDVVGVRGPLVRVARSLERRGLIRRVAVAMPLLEAPAWHRVTKAGLELADELRDELGAGDMLLLRVPDEPTLEARIADAKPAGKADDGNVPW